MRRLAACLLLGPLSVWAQGPEPIDIEMNIRMMLEAGDEPLTVEGLLEEEPPLLSGEDAPIIEPEPEPEPEPRPNHLPLPEKTIIIDGLKGVDTLRQEIEAARQRQQQRYGEAPASK